MTTASRLGLPDLAFASLHDFASTGQMIANIDPRVPLIADADTGFGGPNAIARTVQMYDRLGIAGFHIEDQIQMKRCGQLGGKKLVDVEIWKTRIRAAVAGREAVPGGSDIVIIARTDALASHGMEESIKRVSGGYGMMIWWRMRITLLSSSPREIWERMSVSSKRSRPRIKSNTPSRPSPRCL